MSRARKYIVRLDSDRCRTHGWHARVYPEPGSPKYRSRLFSDRRHGGKGRAKAAARRWLKAGGRTARQPR